MLSTEPAPAALRAGVTTGLWRASGLTPLAGAELTLELPDAGLRGAHVTLLALDRTGGGDRCRPVSHTRPAREQGEARLPAAALAARATGSSVCPPRPQDPTPRWFIISVRSPCERRCSRVERPTWWWARGGRPAAAAAEGKGDRRDDRHAAPATLPAHLLIHAGDLNAAIQVAARMPPARPESVAVRPSKDRTPR